MGIAAIAGAGISAAGGLLGASESSSAAQRAANDQVKSTVIATNTQKQFFNKAQNALQPFMNLGDQASSDLSNRLGALSTSPTVPGPMTEQDLESTPGYQFTLNQGLKATQNGAAARGLGISGAALKGAASYATGLSDQTYNTRFNQAQTNYQDAVNNNTNDFNKLYSTAGLGTQAAGALAGQAITTGQGVASSQIGAGNAQAAGINAGGQAYSSAISGTSGAFNNALNQYLAGSASGLYGSSPASGGLANSLGSNFLNGGF